jgi:glycosyltransferase involved in cell wall biosynthesis
VTSSTPALVELVGGAGFTVDPDDARHMAGSILATLNDASLARELSQKALARAAEFSWERTAAATTAVYQQALAAT